MDLFELKKEQARLAHKIVLRDSFDKIKTIAGVECFSRGNKLLASIVVCNFPSLEFKESKTYLLHNFLSYHPEFQAYQEMPAIIEAYNSLDEEPDLILVKGTGILHPRKIGLASHLGLALNKPTIGISLKLSLGSLNERKIFYQNELVGFELVSRKHSNPLYVTLGHLVSLGTMLEIVNKSLKFPHKVPEPMHLAHKIGKKKLNETLVQHQTFLDKMTQKSENLPVAQCIESAKSHISGLTNHFL
jgi:deoxyribonuclease V